MPSPPPTRETPADYLADDMSPTDLIEVLQHLPFGARGNQATLTIDRGVRDYLVQRIKPHTRP